MNQQADRKHAPTPHANWLVLIEGQTARSFNTVEEAREWAEPRQRDHYDLDFRILSVPEIIHAVNHHAALCDALRKAAETFEDMERTFNMLGRDTLADAAGIAGKESRRVLADAQEVKP